MHILITGGKHPFYDREQDDSNTFKKKLSVLKTVEPDDSFSWLARNLFSKLLMIQSHKRYSAKDTLKHPWITRRAFDKIP